MLTKSLFVRFLLMCRWSGIIMVVKYLKQSFRMRYIETCYDFTLRKRASAKPTLTAIVDRGKKGLPPVDANRRWF